MLLAFLVVCNRDENNLNLMRVFSLKIFYLLFLIYYLFPHSVTTDIELFGFIIFIAPKKGK